MQLIEDPCAAEHGIKYVSSNMADTLMILLTVSKLEANAAALKRVHLRIQNLVDVKKFICRRHFAIQSKSLFTKHDPPDNLAQYDKVS